MNKRIVKTYIEEYKNKFDFVHNQEIYKWQAVKQFQDNWDINSPNFNLMLDKSLKLVANLLDSGQYFPKRMLLKNAEKEPEKIKTLFEFLYDEEFDLFERIEFFRSEFKQLNNLNFPDKKDYQDHRAIIVYLALRYPERYFFYKFRMFKVFSEKIDYSFKPKMGKIENIGQFQSLCSLIKYELSQDQELLKLHKNRIAEDCYYDENLTILTQDFVYAVSQHLEQSVNIKKDDAQEFNAEIINSTEISISKTELDFTPKTINFIQNGIENKRIGDLGELLVIEMEKQKLMTANKPKLAGKVKHVAKDKGDGLGYDILSYDIIGNEIFIEVKTTKGKVNSTFFITRNELERSIRERDNYYLYRIFNFNDKLNNGELLIIKGDLTNLCEVPLTYKVNMKAEMPVGNKGYI